MKLLIFATGDFYSRPNPSFHLLTTLITDCLKAGNNIHLVGMAEAGVEKHIPDEFENNKCFSYSLVKTKPVKKSNFVKRFISGIKYAYDAKKYLKEYIPGCDVVFVRSSPTVFFNIRNVRKYVTKQKVIYGIQDMFPGSTIASGKMPNRLMQLLFYRMQKKAYAMADVITVISEDMKMKLMEQGVQEEKIHVIVNWFDDHSVREIPKEENLFIRKYDMKDDIFYVQYAGTMGYVFDYKMVLNVAERLLNHRDIVFQMIGAGSQKDDFISEAKERGLDNIVFLPLEPQEMVPHVYSACSVCFIPLKKGIIGNSVPSKAGLLMACRRAIVTTADDGSDYNDMINNNQIGIACSTEDVEGATEAILKMKNEPLYREMCASAGYNYGAVLFSRTENTKKFINLFNSLL